MPEAHINTRFGKIVIEYNSQDDLQKELAGLPDAVKLIESEALGLQPVAVRAPKPGFENVYRFDNRGLLELLRRPNNKVDLVALVLYAFDPETISISQIEKYTGLSDVRRNIISSGTNKRYFDEKADGSYGLSPEGHLKIKKSFSPGV